MQVDSSNFIQVLPKVIEQLQKCNFVAIDIEFSGLSRSEEHMPSLFDSLEERYDKLKANVSTYIPVEFGISLFTKNSERNDYHSNTLSFYCCPRFYGPPINRFSVEACAIEFLADNKFDFNKFARSGIPFLNRPQEEVFRNHMRDKSSFDITYSMSDRINELRMKISEWITKKRLKVEGRTGERTFRFIPFANPLSSYLVINLLRKEFPQFSLTLEGDTLFVKTVTSEEKKKLASKLESEEQECIDFCIGVSKVIKAIIDSRKPIVGNNMMVDLVILYQHFIEPLPETLDEFKTELLKVFPVIYDIRSIIFNIKQFFPAYQDDLTAGNLEALYKKVSKQSFIKRTSFQPTIIRDDKMINCEVVTHYHDAGSDAYATGYVFLRICAMIMSKEPEIVRVFASSFESFMTPIDALKNKINLIRAAYHYLDLEADSQETERPEWLVLRSRTGDEPIILSELQRSLKPLNCAIDYRQINETEVILAIGNFRIARELIDKYQTDEQFMLTKYHFIQDTKTGRLFLWTTIILGAGSAGYLLYKTVTSEKFASLLNRLKFYYQSK